VRFVIPISLLLAATACADTCRVLIDGTGCRTRQQAIQRIFVKLPDVEKVTILPRSESPADNQRIFVIESKAATPSKETLIEALGRRAKFYRVLTVEEAS
jgi:hypothetical protein